MRTVARRHSRSPQPDTGLPGRRLGDFCGRGAERGVDHEQDQLVFGLDIAICGHRARPEVLAEFAQG